MKEAQKLLDKQFLELNLSGTPLIDFKEFYKQFHEYQDLSKELKNQVKLFLYSAYYIDKYRFSPVATWKKIEIEDKNTGEATYFALEKYLKKRLHSKENASLKEKDIGTFVSSDAKEISVCFSKEMSQALYYMIKRAHEDCELFLKEIFCKIEEKFKISLKDKESVINKISYEIYLICNKLQGLNFDLFYKCLIDLYINIITTQYPNINKNKLKKYLLRIKKDWNPIFENLSLISKLKSKDNEQIEIANLHVWDILTDKNLCQYLSKASPIKLEVKYIGQAFGKKGSRNVYDRIGGGHKHMLELMSLCPENQEMAVNFFSLQPKNEMIGKVKDEHFIKYFKSILEGKNKIDPSQFVNLAELSLITYFKPSDNKELKNRIFSKPNEDLKIISEINKKYSGVIVSLYLKEDNIKIFSERRSLEDAFDPRKYRIQYKFDTNLSFMIPIVKQYKEI